MGRTFSECQIASFQSLRQPRRPRSPGAFASVAGYLEGAAEGLAGGAACCPGGAVGCAAGAGTPDFRL